MAIRHASRRVTAARPPKGGAGALLDAMVYMFAIVIAGILVAALLLILLARYAQNPSDARRELEESREPRPSVFPEPGPFFDLVRRLLASMGLEETDAQELGREGAMRLEVQKPGAFKPECYVVYVFAKRGGGEVDASDLLRVAGDVEHTDVGRGVVITHDRIDLSATAGLGTDLDLVDGLALLQLIDEHAPTLRDELAGSRIRGLSPPRTRSTAPKPRFAPVHGPPVSD